MISAARASQTGRTEAVYFRPLPHPPEARRIAHSSASEKQNTSCSESSMQKTVQELVAPVSQLENQHQPAPHLAKVERRGA
jgi:hypothetical protein